MVVVVASLVFPGMDSWITSRKKAADREVFASALAALPLRARVNGETIVISKIDELMIDNINASFLEPVTVLASGFCLGGLAELSQSQKTQRLKIKAPFCDVEYVR